MKRYRVGASVHNAPNWPGFLSAKHKGAELCRKNGGTRYSIICFTPRQPTYRIDSWDSINNRRSNEDSVNMGKAYKYVYFENLPRFWVKYG